MSKRLPLPVRTPAERDSGTVGEREIHAVAAATGFSHAPTVPLSHSGAAPDPSVAPLWAALRDVMDPEFPITIVDLGLIYDVRRWGDVVEVDLTFTATACPCMDFIREDIRERLLREDGVGEVRILEVWSPPWTRARISAEGRAVLRKHGVAT